MNICIAVSLQPRHCAVYEWHAPPGARVKAALDHLQHTDKAFAAKANEDWHCAVWGKPVQSDHVLSEGDRLEVLRPLRVDPKVARRERFQQQGAKTAGLFAKRRSGAKPGY